VRNGECGIPDDDLDGIRGGNKLEQDSCAARPVPVGKRGDE
jgi:hypothetical protein